MGRTIIGKLKDTKIPCTSCATEKSLKYYAAHSGGDPVERVCQACARAKRVVQEAKDSPVRELTDPGRIKTCWDCHDAPTRSRTKRLCFHCEDARKKRQTEILRATKYLEGAAAARAATRKKKWQQPAQYDEFVAVMVATEAVTALERELRKAVHAMTHGEEVVGVQQILKSTAAELATAADSIGLLGRQ